MSGDWQPTARDAAVSRWSADDAGGSTVAAPHYRRASRIPRGALSEPRQRALQIMLFMVAALHLLLPPQLLNLATGYTLSGGFPLFKIHFSTYMLCLAFAYTALCVGIIRFVADQFRDRFGIAQFAVVVVLCAGATVLRQGISGLAYMIDTLLAAAMVSMLALYLDEARRRAITVFLVWFVTANAVIAILEAASGFQLLGFAESGKFSYFRATAFLGHPLSNALISSGIMVLVLALPWTASRKLVVLSICMIGILAFGARAALGSTVMMGLLAITVCGFQALRRGELRLTTIGWAPWVAAGALVGGSALAFATRLGERIVALAMFDESAQERLDSFRLFDYLSSDQILYGVDAAEIRFLTEIDKQLEIIENCWIGISLLLGVVLFIPFAVSLLGYLFSLVRGRGVIAVFALVNFLLIASTNNSLSTKSPALVLFSLAVVGLPRRARPEPAPSAAAAAAYERMALAGRNQWALQ